MEKAVYTLKIGLGFPQLVQPLRRSSYHRLRQSVLREGAQTPVLVWRSYVLEDFDQYALFAKHQIPFECREMDFSSREEALAWVCAKQLLRKDLTEERRKYLIGIQLDVQRVAIAKKKHAETSLHTGEYEDLVLDDLDYPRDLLPSAKAVAQEIGTVNHISWNTVIKYADYAKHIEAIRKKHTDLANKILIGRCMVSHKSVAALASKTVEELEELNQQLKKRTKKDSKRKDLRLIVPETASDAKQNRPSGGPSVKDMPTYDPDAEIKALTYTVPSWGESVRRVREKVNFEAVTEPAKKRLFIALSNLMRDILSLLEIVRDE